MQLLVNLGWHKPPEHQLQDYQWIGDEALKSNAELYERILSTLRSIPDAACKSYTRRNVRPAGASTCNQMTLGLVSCATHGRVPMLTAAAWNLIGVTKLILVYMQKLGDSQSQSRAHQSS